MATITATNNQQFYANCYPMSQTSVNLASNTPHQHVAYQQQQQQQYHIQHPHQQHAQQHQQQQHHVQQYQPQSQQIAVIGQDQTTNLTQLGQHQNQRTLSASTNSSNAAAALYNIEAIKSTKGASKLRRDLINTEIAQLRELLPLSTVTRQRLSQLQLMALVLVYVRKSNYFCNAFRNYAIAREPSLTIADISFPKALNGFLMMLTQKGKLLYISDNASDYLGHSMEDLLSHGDEVYDIIEDQDKKTIRTELLSNDEDSQSSPTTKSLQQPTNLPTSETRIALCRMNVSRNGRRQMRFGDQKVVLIEGHFFGFLPLSSRDEPVFLATCKPIAMPETRDCIVEGNTNVFTSLHSMDMKFQYIDEIGEYHLGYTKQQILGKSWYEIVHPDHLSEAQLKHKRITTNEQERSTIILLRMMNKEQTGYIWIHCVMQVKEDTGTPKPVIYCINQILSEREAQVMRSNSWLYQFYSLHSKAHCNFSSSSPIHANQTATPNSVCSESDDRNDTKSNNRASTLTTINASTLPVDVLAKSPPASIINNNSNSNQDDSVSSPARSTEAFQSGIQDNYARISGGGGVASGGNTSNPNNASYNGYQQAATSIQYTPSINNKSNTGGISSKLSPITNSPSSSSNISSSPLSSSSLYPQQQRYHQLTSSSIMINPSLNGNNLQSTDIHHQHHTSNSIGSSSASSTSSSSSSSSSSTSSTLNEISTTPTTNLASHNVAQAVAAAAGSTAAAASLYAGIEAIDPLQHMHHPAHHHSMYSAATGHQHHSSHTAAAVNYANQVMAAQRVAHSHHHHHHHHPYHPYNHHHHHQKAGWFDHQSSHVAPHHHNHHTGYQSNHTTPHALYAPHHHVAAASTVALNSAFNHHTANYHSAMAAATSANPTHATHPAQASAAAHQGVSFHKIVAAVNASA